MFLKILDIRLWPVSSIISVFAFIYGISSFPLFILLPSFSFNQIVSAFYPPFIVVPLMISVFHAADFILTKLLHFWKRWHAQAGNFWRASGLGFAFAIGAYLVFCSNVFLSESKVLWCFGLYVCVISFFHWSEFFFASLFYSKTASIDLYMLNHSPEYLAAAACSIFEHWVGSFIRYFFLTNYCAPAWLNLLGLFICIGGETLRKAAIITASTNFNHHVQFYKRQDHELVTYGVYSCFRHPAYVGWFYWSLGTQILLANPICTIAYPIAAYRFFDERIFIEEASLVKFFGQQYRDYQKAVGCGIPFIKGCISADGESNKATS